MNGQGVAQWLGLLELRAAEMTAWLAAHPVDAANLEYRAIAAAVDAERVEARVAFIAMADHVADIWSVVQLDGHGDDLWRRLVDRYGVDLSERGRTERVYRRQWREWLRVNPEPCPF